MDAGGLLDNPPRGCGLPKGMPLYNPNNISPRWQVIGDNGEVDVERSLKEDKERILPI